ncbi:MAG: hypothetical protein EOP10_31580 [Proteobacteria bacterium]|nr:MAG: hypothetical protein EOP10_31580 [Pseudomonadota bacterium]
MKNLAPALALLIVSSSLTAAEFKLMKAGEWRSELIEPKVGQAAPFIKPSNFCIREKDKIGDWEKNVKDQMAKSNMDCTLTQKAQEAASVSYAMDCKAKASEGGKPSNIPAGTTYEGTTVLKRESDTVYLVESDSLVKGLKISDADLSKIPAEHRAAAAAALAMSAGGVKLKTVQKLSFVKASCDKSPNQTTQSESAPSVPAKK